MNMDAELEITEGDISIQEEAQKISERRRLQAQSAHTWKFSKSHHQYLMEEMQWMAKEFMRERNHKISQARKIAKMMTKQVMDPEKKEELRQKEEEARKKKAALNISKEINKWWHKAYKIAQHKYNLSQREESKKQIDKQLDFLLEKTEKYSIMLVQQLGQSLDSYKQSNALPPSSQQQDVEMEDQQNQDNGQLIVKESKMDVDISRRLEGEKKQERQQEQQQQKGGNKRRSTKDGKNNKRKNGKIENTSRNSSDVESYSINESEEASDHDSTLSRELKEEENSPLIDNEEEALQGDANLSIEELLAKYYQKDNDVQHDNNQNDDDKDQKQESAQRNNRKNSNRKSSKSSKKKQNGSVPKMEASSKAHSLQKGFSVKELKQEDKELHTPRVASQNKEYHTRSKSELTHNKIDDVHTQNEVFPLQNEQKPFKNLRSTVTNSEQPAKSLDRPAKSHDKPRQVNSQTNANDFIGQRRRSSSQQGRAVLKEESRQVSNQIVLRPRTRSAQSAANLSQKRESKAAQSVNPSMKKETRNTKSMDAKQYKDNKNSCSIAINSRKETRASQQIEIGGIRRGNSRSGIQIVEEIKKETKSQGKGRNSARGSQGVLKKGSQKENDTSNLRLSSREQRRQRREKIVQEQREKEEEKMLEEQKQIIELQQSEKQGQQLSVKDQVELQKQQLQKESQQIEKDNLQQQDMLESEQQQKDLQGQQVQPKQEIGEKEKTEVVDMEGVEVTVQDKQFEQKQEQIKRDNQQENRQVDGPKPADLQDKQPLQENSVERQQPKQNSIKSTAKATSTQQEQQQQSSGKQGDQNQGIAQADGHTQTEEEQKAASVLLQNKRPSRSSKMAALRDFQKMGEEQIQGANDGLKEEHQQHSQQYNVVAQDTITQADDITQQKEDKTSTAITEGNKRQTRSSKRAALRSSKRLNAEQKKDTQSEDQITGQDIQKSQIHESQDNQQDEQHGVQKGLQAIVSDNDQPQGNQLSSIIEAQKQQIPQIPTPFFLKHTLREYQLVGLNWLWTLSQNNVNSILADEMGLGKTIQTIALLTMYAVEKAEFGPHLIVVPTSVMLNWEMEFKKWAPMFRILTYFGSQKERKIKRQGWSKSNAFHICITSYALIAQDAKMFKRKKWRYVILDEAHMIKNWRTKRWQILVNLNSRHRLLITGTPLQNDLMELWSLMHFLMPQLFSSHDAFKDWFSNPLTGMVEGVKQQRKDIIDRLHAVLRPFILRRLKKEVEKQLPAKYEHVVTCRLSKRQRNLYEEYMQSSDTQSTLRSGNALGLINVLMQLRKVCNHPDLFEGRQIRSPFDCEPISLQFPRKLVYDIQDINLDLQKPLTKALDVRIYNDPKFQFNLHPDFLLGGAEELDTRQMMALFEEKYNEDDQNTIEIEFQEQQIQWDQNYVKIANESRTLSSYGLALIKQNLKKLNDKKLAFKRQVYLQQQYTNKLRFMTSKFSETNYLQQLLSIDSFQIHHKRSYTASTVYTEGLDLQDQPPSTANRKFLELYEDEGISKLFLQETVKNFVEREKVLRDIITKFVCVIPKVRTTKPEIVISKPDISTVRKIGQDMQQLQSFYNNKSEVLHSSAIRQQLFFPDKWFVQYDCGKLQKLAELLKKLQQQGHRALIFTQMAKMLDVLEVFLNLHRYTYMRLDGQTSPEQRQILMTKFNQDRKYFLFILSTRSGGVGINLTGADTVIFYDSDWNPAIDQQAQDRCHRIGQTHEVHIYRLMTENTMEENILLKSQQKRELDFLAIQSGKFNQEFFDKVSAKDILGGGQAMEIEEMQDQNDTQNLSNEEIKAAMRNAEDVEDAQAAMNLEKEQREDFDEPVEVGKEIVTVNQEDKIIDKSTEMQQLDEVNNYITTLSKIDQYAIKLQEQEIVYEAAMQGALQSQQQKDLDENQNDDQNNDDDEFDDDAEVEFEDEWNMNEVKQIYQKELVSAQEWYDTEQQKYLELRQKTLDQIERRKEKNLKKRIRLQQQKLVRQQIIQQKQEKTQKALALRHDQEQNISESEAETQLSFDSKTISQSKTQQITQITQTPQQTQPESTQNKHVQQSKQIKKQPPSIQVKKEKRKSLASIDRKINQKLKIDKDQIEVKIQQTRPWSEIEDMFLCMSVEYIFKESTKQQLQLQVPLKSLGNWFWNSVCQLIANIWKDQRCHQGVDDAIFEKFATDYDKNNDQRDAFLRNFSDRSTQECQLRYTYLLYLKRNSSSQQSSISQFSFKQSILAFCMTVQKFTQYIKINNSQTDNEIQNDAQKDGNNEQYQLNWQPEQYYEVFESCLQSLNNDNNTVETQFLENSQSDTNLQIKNDLTNNTNEQQGTETSQKTSLQQIPQLQDETQYQTYKQDFDYIFDQFQGSMQTTTIDINGQQKSLFNLINLQQDDIMQLFGDCIQSNSTLQLTVLVSRQLTENVSQGQSLFKLEKPPLYRSQIKDILQIQAQKLNIQDLKSKIEQVLEDLQTQDQIRNYGQVLNISKQQRTQTARRLNVPQPQTAQELGLEKQQQQQSKNQQVSTKKWQINQGQKHPVQGQQVVTQEQQDTTQNVNNNQESTDLATDPKLQASQQGIAKNTQNSGFQSQKSLSNQVSSPVFQNRPHQKMKSLQKIENQQSFPKSKSQLKSLSQYIQQPMQLNHTNTSRPNSQQKLDNRVIKAQNGLIPPGKESNQSKSQQMSKNSTKSLKEDVSGLSNKNQQQEISKQPDNHGQVSVQQVTPPINQSQKDHRYQKKPNIQVIKLNNRPKATNSSQAISLGPDQKVQLPIGGAKSYFSIQSSSLKRKSTDKETEQNTNPGKKQKITQNEDQKNQERAQTEQ